MLWDDRADAMGIRPRAKAPPMTLLSLNGRRSAACRRPVPSNISELEEAQEAERFQADLLDAVGQAVFATDMAGVVLYWNRAAGRMFGWCTGDAVGRKLLPLLVSEETMEAGSAVLSPLRPGESRSGERWVKRRDGSRFLADVTTSPVFGADGRLAAIISVAADVTERKAGEDARRQLGAIIDRQIA
jgi:PAS domain S-box-containing protein